MEAFAACPQARLGEIELLTPAEYEAIVAMGRGPEASLPAPVHEQILTHAAITPDATAVAFDGADDRNRLTFGELAERSLAVAARLQARGIGRGAVVAVCIERSPDLVVALLGVLRCGAAYLPIDPDYPTERIAYVLADSGCRLALVDASGDAILEALPGIEQVRVANCLRDANREARHADVRADDLAYILYTSGSTGQPKGVAITHGNLANFLQTMSARTSLCASDRLLAITTIAFDISGLELLGPLIQGGTVVLTDTATARDGLRLADVLARNRITVMQATPAGWRLLIEAGWRGLPGLKIFCGGEALDNGLATGLLARGAELWNLYGPTETTIWSSTLRLEPSLLNEATVPVGGALDCTQLYVLDQRGSPVPVGVPAELAIGGVGVSPGYWSRPALTAERFIPDAHGSSGAASVLYRTGDRVRWREDGLLEFLGRLDGQIKLRGHRIELGEIEARIASHGDVARTVVILSDDKANPRLVAFIRWRQEGAIESLRSHLAEALPVYLLPSAYLPVDELPLTPNGKIDRRALQARVRATASANQREPTPSAEMTDLGEPAATLTEIWRQALHIERVRPQDNFFELGGNSLLAVTVQSAIRKRLEAPLEIVDIFRFPTLETLATHVAALGHGRQDATPKADRARAIAQGQERLRQLRLRRA